MWFFKVRHALPRLLPGSKCPFAVTASYVRVVGGDERPSACEDIITFSAGPVTHSFSLARQRIMEETLDYSDLSKASVQAVQGSKCIKTMGAVDQLLLLPVSSDQCQVLIHLISTWCLNLAIKCESYRHRKVQCWFWVCAKPFIHLSIIMLLDKLRIK